MNTQQNTQIHQPLVSVMIPYYNCQDYIAETIESVEQQTYPNVEIIIVNDGSAQEHTDYLKQLLLNKPHVQYYFQQNKGLAATRNAAAQYAKGTYFLFLDADDVILPTYVERCVDILENNPQYKLVYPMVEYFDAKTGIWDLPPYDGLKNLLISNRLPSSISVHRAEDFHRIGGFDDSLPTHEDWDYWIRLLAQGGEVYRIPEVLFRYRKRQDASSLIDGVLRDKNVLREDIQKIYLKNSTIFAEHDLSYWDLLHFYWDINYFKNQHVELSRSVSSKQQRIAFLQKQFTEYKRQKNEEIAHFRDAMSQMDANIQYLNFNLEKAQSNWYQHQKLWSVKLLKPLIKLESGIQSINQYRKAFRHLCKEKGGIQSAYQFCQSIYSESGMKGVKKYLKNEKELEIIPSVHLLVEPEEIEKRELTLEDFEDGLVILTTPHTHYIARLLQNSLNKINVSSQIIFNQPLSGYSDQWHIVICPQIFESLPKYYMAFQMEQSISDRWFTESYLTRLENAAYIFDYSMKNVDFLQSKGFPFSQIYYLPVGLLRENQDIDFDIDFKDEYEYDVAFYGTPHCERRQLFLEKLSEHFSVKIISEVFGDELYALLRKAKVIVNIHYYENALLETTRLYECLSLNKIVVSEMGADQSEHAELEKLIDFTEIGNIDAMIERIQYWLSTPNALEDRKQLIAQKNQKVSQFDFYFYRFLLAQDLIEFNQFYDLCAEYVQPKGDFWCLSLAESVQRRQDFDADNHYNIDIFPGLRHRLGWVGCGLSYKFMLKTAERLHLPQVTICEDDVLFPENFAQRYAHIKDYLHQNQGSWDIFSGLISDLSEDVAITHTTTPSISEDEQFYGINKMVSTVCNVYACSAYAKIYEWDYQFRDTSNTIDRYIEHHGGIRGLVVSPFLVGHKEDLHSTLWGFQNTTYRDMIHRSQALLDSKIAELGN